MLQWQGLPWRRLDDAFVHDGVWPKRYYDEGGAPSRASRLARTVVDRAMRLGRTALAGAGDRMAGGARSNSKSQCGGEIFAISSASHQQFAIRQGPFRVEPAEHS